MVHIHLEKDLAALGAHGQGGPEVTDMVAWKNMAFWRAQQQQPRKQRVTNVGHFNPEGDVERAIESVGGTHWMQVAQNRAEWQRLSDIFILRHDVPWASGKQQSIQDNLIPRARRAPANTDLAAVH